MQDPEIMEIFGVLMGGEGDAPPAPRPTASSSSAKGAVVEDDDDDADDVDEVSPEEEKKRKNKKLALDAKERGNALYKEKKFEEALAAYDEAIALDSSAVMFHSNKAAVFIEMGEADKAVEVCEAAVQLGRSQRASYVEIAKLYQRMAAAHLKKDDFPAAKECFAKAQMENFDKAIERKVSMWQYHMLTLITDLPSFFLSSC